MKSSIEGCVVREAQADGFNDGLAMREDPVVEVGCTVVGHGEDDVPFGGKEEGLVLGEGAGGVCRRGHFVTPEKQLRGKTWEHIEGWDNFVGKEDTTYGLKALEDRPPQWLPLVAQPNGEK